MRAEHWYNSGSLAGNSNLFVQAVAHKAAAAVLHSVLQHLKAGQITPLAKPTGGHRPRLMMPFLHRLALKSVMAAKKDLIAKCAGPLQCGVGPPDYLLLLTSKLPSRRCLGDRHSWDFHTTSLSKQHPCDPIRNLLLLLPRQTRQSHLPQRLPYSRRSIPPKWEHTQLVLATHKRSASTALA